MLSESAYHTTDLGCANTVLGGGVGVNITFSNKSNNSVETEKKKRK